MAQTNAALKARIERLVKKWRPIMGLDSWLLDVRYDETEHLGTCLAKPKYEEATIRFNLKRIRQELPPGLPALEELVCHELVHCLIWRANETEVSRMTRIILRARDAA